MNDNTVTGQFSDSGSMASRCDGPSDIASHRPIPKLQALSAALLGRWRCSLARIVLGECYRFPLRILAILRTSESALGPVVPLTLWDHSRARLYPPSNFSLACIDHIQRLQNEAPWAGYLEAQLLARAFQMGARWGASNNSEKCNAGVP
jgi:hypothetical protein